MERLYKQKMTAIVIWSKAKLYKIWQRVVIQHCVNVKKFVSWGVAYVCVRGRWWYIRKKSASDISTKHYVTLCRLYIHISYTIYTYTVVHKPFIKDIYGHLTLSHSLHCSCLQAHLTTNHCSEIIVLPNDLQNTHTHSLCSSQNWVKTMLHVRSFDTSGHMNPSSAAV